MDVLQRSRSVLSVNIWVVFAVGYVMSCLKKEQSKLDCRETKFILSINRQYNVQTPIQKLVYIHHLTWRR